MPLTVRALAADRVVRLATGLEACGSAGEHQSAAPGLTPTPPHPVHHTLQLGSAPLLVREYMRLFANACRLMLLLKAVPRKDLVQVGHQVPQGCSRRWCLQVPCHRPVAAQRGASSSALGKRQRPACSMRRARVAASLATPALQLYTIACHELVGRDPPGRRALCSYLAACDAPVALLQSRFLCIAQRVCQVRPRA